MESITIKVDDAFAREIDAAMKPDYTTKTEFIREAIRDKVKELKEDKALIMLKKYFGAAKKHVSDAQLERTREKLAEKYFKGVRLD